MISLEHYRIFYYVATFQSITHAASHLYISQPAVSKAVHKLESEMGCSLFTRTPHGSVLTPEGTVLYSHVSRAMKELEEGENKVFRLSGTEHQIIRIGATESPLYSSLVPALSDFREEYPNVMFQIKGGSTADLISMLRGNAIDVAIGVTPLTGVSGIPVIELSELRDVFFSHIDYPVDDRSPLTQSEVCALPIVGVGPDSSAGSHIAAYFHDLGLEYSPSFMVKTSTNVLPIVENRLAIALAPEWVISSSTIEDKLRVLNTSFYIPPRKIFLAYNESREMSPLNRIFIDRVIRQKPDKSA